VAAQLCMPMVPFGYCPAGQVGFPSGQLAAQFVQAMAYTCDRA